MSTASESSYDEIPYISKPFALTHPDHLAAVATLYGMHPPAADRCRVLELACAGGGNLLPMAVSTPQGRFVGIDLSPRQIEDGQAIVKALGLTNIELRTMSILDVSPEMGEFDYIVSHGVYSWVPPAVQDKILEITARNLAPNGVGYVSYNTYPGWHLRGMVREMLCYHVRKFDEPRERLHQARAFLDFLISALPDSKTAYAQLLQDEHDLLQGATESYVFHEHLEAVNLPLYFHEFMDRASAKGLQFLAEARFSPLSERLSADALHTVQQLGGDILEQEQYFDFLRRATFRRTLLCHANLDVQRPPTPLQLGHLWFTPIARPASARPDISPGVVEEFRAPGGLSMTTNQPVPKAVLAVLAERAPRAVAFADLHTEVSARVGQYDVDTGGLVEIVLRSLQANLIALHAQPPRAVFEITSRPVASPLARLQAATDDYVANLRNGLVELSPLERALVPLLDGTRDRAELTARLIQMARADDFTFNEHSQPVRDPARIEELVRLALDGSLRRLADHSLFVG